MYNKTTNKNSLKDVTQEWLDDAKPNNYTIKDRNYFEYNGVKHKVDGKMFF